MVVHVAIAEALPFGMAHAAEDGVFAPRKAERLPGKARQDSQEFLAILFEIDGRGAGDLLIPLGTGRNPGWPWEWEPQGDVSHGQAREDARCEAHIFFAHAGAEYIGDMADHLVGRHGSPAARAGGQDGLEAEKDLVPIGRIGEGFHPYQR